jgi:hypothetical protein
MQPELPARLLFSTQPIVFLVHPRPPFALEALQLIVGHVLTPQRNNKQQQQPITLNFLL